MTKNKFLATTLCEIVEDMLASSDITIKSKGIDTNDNAYRLYGIEYDNLRKDFENRINIEYVDGKNTDWGYARKLFVLSHDNHSKSTQTKLQVYSDYSQANEAMFDYLEKIKDTSFWWNKDKNQINPNCEFGISSTHFAVYEKDKESNHELFAIEECVVDLPFRITENAVAKLDDLLNAKSIRAYDIYLQEYYDKQDKNKLPDCYEEFLWKEWQDIEGRKYYENKMAKSTKDSDNEM